MAKQKKKNRQKQKINFFKNLHTFTYSLFAKFKYILRLLIICIIAVGVSIVLLLNNVDPNKYKSDLEDALKHTLGRSVSINGNIEWDIFSFEPAIKIEKLSIANAKWGKTKNIFEADNIVVILSLKHLLTRKISVDTILIENSNMFLEVSTKGKENWDLKTLFNTKQPSIQTLQEKLKNDEEILKQAIKYPEFEIAVKSIQIKNSKIHYDNRLNKINENIDVSDLMIYSKNYSSPIFLDIDFKYKNSNYNGNFKTISLEEIIDQKKSLPIIGIVNLNGIKLNVISQITDITKLNSLTANINFQAPNIKEAVKDFISLPNFEEINGEFDIIVAPKIISIKKLNLKYNNLTNLLGDIDIVLDKKPDIKANVKIPLFDIPKIFYPLWEPAYFERLETGKEKTKRPKKEIKDPKAFRNVPLPVKEFDMANVILNLEIGKLKAMPEMPIENIKLIANLNDGKAIIAPLSMNYMGGKLVLDIIANNENNTFNGNVSIKGSDINIGETIASTGYKNVFTGGNTNIDIVLKGIGKNLEEFMKNLNGYVKVYTTSDLIGYRIENMVMATDLVSSIFKFIGDDILGTITGADTTPEKSVINCAVVNLNIENGKTISNRGIAIQTKVANIVIDGLVNLGDEKVDVSIITIVKEGMKMSNSLAEMIKIEGPMAKPNIIISKEGVINNVAKTTFVTGILGALTGGMTLITAGLGMLTKSWIENIQSDKNPCLTAYEGKIDKKDEEAARNAFGKQIILRETFIEQIQQEKSKLNKATSSTINETRNNAKSTIKSK